MSNGAEARLVSVNVGQPREVEHHGRRVATSIFKTPTTRTVEVAGVNIAGDEQADRVAHGGPDKAVYAYASEDAAWWAGELGIEIEPAFFGENLATEGIDVSAANVGDRWVIGTAVFEVSEPRVPCFKLALRTGVPRIQQAFARADRPGAYLRIIESGHIRVGDTVTVTPTTEPTISVRDIAAIYHRDHASAGRLAEVSRLSDAWRRWGDSRR